MHMVIMPTMGSRAAKVKLETMLHTGATGTKDQPGTREMQGVLHLTEPTVAMATAVQQANKATWVDKVNVGVMDQTGYTVATATMVTMECVGPQELKAAVAAPAVLEKQGSKELLAVMVPMASLVVTVNTAKLVWVATKEHSAHAAALVMTGDRESSWRMATAERQAGKAKSAWSEQRVVVATVDRWARRVPQALKDAWVPMDVMVTMAQMAETEQLGQQVTQARMEHLAGMEHLARTEIKVRKGVQAEMAPMGRKANVVTTAILVPLVLGALLGLPDVMGATQLTATKATKE